MQASHALRLAYRVPMLLWHVIVDLPITLFFMTPPFRRIRMTALEASRMAERSVGHADSIDGRPTRRLPPTHCVECLAMGTSHGKEAPASSADVPASERRWSCSADLVERN